MLVHFTNRLSILYYFRFCLVILSGIRKDAPTSDGSIENYATCSSAGRVFTFLAICYNYNIRAKPNFTPKSFHLRQNPELLGTKMFLIFW